MSGLYTFKATSYPVDLSLALYTYPMEAEAIGWGEISVKTSVTLKPSSFSNISKAFWFVKTGTSSQSY